MKIFISWSGSLSQNIAECLKEWLPCFIQSIEVFFSSNDIEKGEKWDSKISDELDKCDFGIICLTNENTNAPWIHFEAGALSTALNSKLAALMVNIKTSDIQGPLSRYQATKVEKGDFLKLLKSINNSSNVPLDESILERAFSTQWDGFHDGLQKIISSASSELPVKQPIRQTVDNQPLEEILQLLRSQNVLLNSPDKLFPLEYFYSLQKSDSRDTKLMHNLFYKELIAYFDYLTTLFLEQNDLNLSTIELLNLNRFTRGIRMLIEAEKLEDARLLLHSLMRFDDALRFYYRSSEKKQAENKASNVVKKSMNSRFM